MRVRTILLAILVVVVAVSTAAAAPANVEKTGVLAPKLDQPGMTGAPAPDLPHVARNQRRARTTSVDDGPFDPDFWDWDQNANGGSGGWTQGACNCKRVCNTGGVGCSLAMGGACKTSNGSCSDCLNQECP